MAIKESKARKAFELFNGIFMVALIIATLYPLLYVVFASFSDSDALTTAWRENAVLAHRL